MDTVPGEINRASLTVDAGNLFICDENVTPTVVSDTLDSDLLAQLAADKQSSRLVEPGKWASSYQNILANLFWQNDIFKSSSFAPDTSTFTIKPILLRIFSEACNVSEMKVIDRQLTKFAAIPPKSNGAKLFDKFTQSGDFVCMTASFIIPDSSKRSVILFFGTSEEITRAFTQSFDSDLLTTKINVATYSGSLDETQYATIREQVIEKLGDKTDTLIIRCD